LALLKACHQAIVGVGHRNIDERQIDGHMDRLAWATPASGVTIRPVSTRGLSERGRRGLEKNDANEGQNQELSKKPARSVGIMFHGCSNVISTAALANHQTKSALESAACQSEGLT
jgi:hypothetical protein